MTERIAETGYSWGAWSEEKRSWWRNRQGEIFETPHRDIADEQRKLSNKHGGQWVARAIVEGIRRW